MKLNKQKDIYKKRYQLTILTINNKDNKQF